LWPHLGDDPGGGVAGSRAVLVHNTTSSGSWQTPGDWSSGAVPTAADDVTLNNANFTAASGSVDSLTLSNSQLTLSADLTASVGLSLLATSTLTIDSHAVSGTITADNSGNSTVILENGASVADVGTGVRLQSNAGSNVISGDISNAKIFASIGSLEIGGGVDAQSVVSTTGSLTIDHPADFKGILAPGALSTIDLVGVAPTDVPALGLRISPDIYNTNGDVMVSSADGHGGTLLTWQPAAPTELADALVFNGFLLDPDANGKQDVLTGKSAYDQTITIYDNGVKIGTTYTALAGNAPPQGLDHTFSFSLGKLALGSHHITATLTDPSGRESAMSAPLDFVVSTNVAQLVQNVAGGGNWQIAATWDLDKAPAPTDDVIVTGATVINASDAVHTLGIVDGTVETPQDFTVAGDISLYKGTLTIDGGVTTAANIHGGQVVVDAAATIQAAIQNAGVHMLHGGAIVGALAETTLYLGDGAYTLTGAETDTKILLSTSGAATNLTIADPATVGAIDGMRVGDQLDLAGIVASAETPTYDPASGVLTIRQTNGQDLTLTVRGHLAGDVLSLTDDGQGGTIVAWTLPSYASVVGANGDWNDPNQWKDQIVPSPAGSNDVTLNSSTLTAAEAIGANSLILNDSTLTVEAGLAVHHAIKLFGSSLVASGGAISAESVTGGTVTLAGGASMGAADHLSIVNSAGTNVLTGPLDHAAISVQAGVLEIAGPATDSQVDFAAAGATVKFDDPSDLAPITHMRATDVIDLAGVSVASASYDGATLTLQKTGGGSLALAVSGDLQSNVLQTAPDGHGGTDITWAPPADSLTGVTGTVATDVITSQPELVLNSSDIHIDSANISPATLTLNNSTLSFSGAINSTSINLNDSSIVLAKSSSITEAVINGGAIDARVDDIYSYSTIVSELAPTDTKVLFSNGTLIYGQQTSSIILQGQPGLLGLNTQALPTVEGVAPGVQLLFQGLYDATSVSYDGSTLSLSEADGKTVSLQVSTDAPGLVPHLSQYSMFPYSSVALVTWTYPAALAGPAAPSELADSAIRKGVVNAAGDLATQALTGVAAPGATVTVYNGATALGATTADGAGAWSYTLGRLADGAYNLNATATDANGDVGPKSILLAFQVETGPPNAPTDLADAAIIGGYVNAANNTATQTLTGKADPGDHVFVYDNDSVVQIASTNADASGNWSVTLGTLYDGAHSLTAKASNAGDVFSSPSAPLTFTVDTHAPVPDVLYINRAGADWTIYGYTEANRPVTLFDDGTQIGAGTADSRGVWSITVPLSATALHQFTVHTTDAAGNPGVTVGAAQFSLASAPLVGGAGDDVLIAWGSDTLTGGAGADRFVIDAEFTHRTITDFSPAQHDVLELDAAEYHNYAWVMAHSTQVGADTVIHVNGVDLTLQNVTRTSLHASDFIFA
jgi:hypothetical protein